MEIKLLIADDDMLIRESLKLILDIDPDFEVVACVENGLKAVEYCRENEVDVAMLDIRMPVMNGVDAVKEITGISKARTLILTTFDDDEFITQAIRNGAKGYLLKNNSPDKIKDAIRTVYNGNSIMQDIILDKIKDGLQSNKNKIDREMFSAREFEIIELIAKGKSNKEIAGILYISEGTVKNYISSILTKTNLEHRTQIAIYFLGGSLS